MKNLLNEGPVTDLRGRLAFSRAFVERSDLEQRAVLDIGCGFGWFALQALRAGATSVTGVEPRAADLETARQYLDDERLHFTVASALELPFPDESFDTVSCWEVLEHIPAGTEHKALSEIARVLRPGGVLYLSTPNASPLGKVSDPAWWLAGHRHYASKQVALFAAQAGLIVETIECRGRYWELVQILNLYVAKWIFRRPPFFADAVQRRVDAEWGRSGFVDLFLRARKPA